MPSPIYEREQIEALLRWPGAGPTSGEALCLGNDDGFAREVYEQGVTPALRAAGLSGRFSSFAFDSDSDLARVVSHIASAEVVLADIDPRNGDLMYVLGLCHGIGRCPILLVRDPWELSFNLREFRCVIYRSDSVGLVGLRAELERVIRCHLYGIRGRG